MGRRQWFPLEGVFGGYRIGKGSSTWCAETRDVWHSVMCGPVPPWRTTSCTKLIFSSPKAFMQVKNPFYNCLNLKLNAVLHTNIFCLFVCLHDFKIYWIFLECKLLSHKLREDFILFVLFYQKLLTLSEKKKIT